MLITTTTPQFNSLTDEVLKRNDGWIGDGGYVSDWAGPFDEGDRYDAASAGNSADGLTVLICAWVLELRWKKNCRVFLI